MPAFTRVESAMHGGASGAIPFEIINAGSGGVWSTSGTPTGWQWTTVAGTTLLVACVVIGVNGASAVDSVFSALTFNGVAMAEINHHNADSFPRNAAPGQQWFRTLIPDIVTNGALAPTLGGTGWAAGTPTNNYASIFLFNIRGANAVPIGANDVPDVSATVATGKSDSITSQAAGSILLTCGSVQGGTGSAVLPVFAGADGVTMLGSQVSTGASDTVDGTSAIGWKQLAAAGAQAYGWTWVRSDGNGISAVEIKAP